MKARKRNKPKRLNAAQLAPAQLAVLLSGGTLGAQLKDAFQAMHERVQGLAAPRTRTQPPQSDVQTKAKRPPAPYTNHQARYKRLRREKEVPK